MTEIDFSKSRNTAENLGKSFMILLIMGEGGEW